MFELELQPDPVLERDSAGDSGLAAARPGRARRGPAGSAARSSPSSSCPSKPRKRATTALGGRSSRSRGGPEATRRPSIRISRRSASAHASARSWTTTSVARVGASAVPTAHPRAGSPGPRRRARRTARRAAGRRARTAIARARWTRRRSPPDSVAAGRRERCSAPIARSASRARSARSRAWNAPPGERQHDVREHGAAGQVGRLERDRDAAAALDPALRPAQARRRARRAACSCRRRWGRAARRSRRARSSALTSCTTSRSPRRTLSCSQRSSARRRRRRRSRRRPEAHADPAALVLEQRPGRTSGSGSRRSARSRSRPRRRSSAPSTSYSVALASVWS